MNLRMRILCLLLFAAVPVVAVELVTEYEQRDDRRATLARHVEAQARLAAARIDGLIATDRAVLASVVAFDGPTSAGCSIDLAPLAAVAGAGVDLVVAAADGRVICASSLQFAGQRLAEGPALRAARYGGQGGVELTALSAPFRPGILLLSEPMPQHGMEAAVALLGRPLASIADVVKGLGLDEDATIVIADGEGDAAAWLVGRMASAGEAASDAPPPFFTADVAETSTADVGTAFAELSQLAGFSLGLSLPYAALWEQADYVFLVEVVLFVGIFLLAALIALYGVHAEIERPLRALEAAVARLAAGDFGARRELAHGGITEFRRLAHSVEGLAAALQEREGALIKARDAAESAAVAKTRILAAASHDLRQPFQSVRLFHHLLASRLEDERCRALARHLDNAIQSCENFLDSMLDLTTIETGRVAARPRSIAVAEVLRRLAGEFEPHCREKGLDFRLVSCGATLVTDPVLLERALRNLLGNAARYTDDGKVLLGCRRRGDELRIEVWDTGPGIAPSEIPLIFGEYYRGPGGEVARKADGIGLGLAIVQRISDVLGARISVRSRLGHGSVFAFTLPCAGDTVKATRAA
jgi:signal transduction histidine kinase